MPTMYGVVNPDRMLERVSLVSEVSLPEGWDQEAVELAEVSLHETDMYRFNVTKRKFYHSGPKPSVAAGVVVNAPFADNTDIFFRGTGLVSQSVSDFRTNNAGDYVTTNVDLPISNGRDINGISMMLKGQGFYDYCCFQIVDTTYAFAGDLDQGYLYPATPLEAGVPVSAETTWAQVSPDGVVLNEFGTNWNIDSDSQKQDDIILPIKASVYTGMTIRISYCQYKPDGTPGIDFKCNLFLYEDKS